jgi:hypothetical protein
MPVRHRFVTNVDHIRDGVPFSVELACLLLRDLQNQCNAVILVGAPRLNRPQLDPAPHGRIQNAHQRSLRIAISNLKGLHRTLLELIR